MTLPPFQVHQVMLPSGCSPRSLGKGSRWPSAGTGGCTSPRPSHDVQPCLRPRVVAYLVDALDLQRLEEALHRRSNENTNGLLRQFIPTGVDVSELSQIKLSAIARQLNERPRKTLGYRTSADMLNQCVASAG